MEENETSQYITTGVDEGTSTSGSNTLNTLQWNSDAIISGLVSMDAKVTKDLSPQLYFKYIKKKFGTIETFRLDGRLKRLEKAVLKAIDNGQEMLSEKLLKDISREMRESAMFAKKIKHFIEYEDLWRYKHKIRGGHISDTKLAEFTRVIPKDVLEEKKRVEILFDGFVIYHYWNKDAEKVREGKQKMSPTEKDKMRDPVLFGVIRESNRLYFIADWEDEHCDLTFDEMIDVIGKDDDEFMIPRVPKLNVK